MVQRKEAEPNQSRWLVTVAAASVLIAIVAGWVSFTYGNVRDVIPPQLIVGVFLLGFTAMLVSGLGWLIRKYRKVDGRLPPPGRWAFFWVSFQIACLLALATLGAIALAAIPFGYGATLFQAFLLVLVSSAIMFMVGSAVREFLRVAQSFR